jgi:hemoglobin-like flavoprotein
MIASNPNEVAIDAVSAESLVSEMKSVGKSKPGRRLKAIPSTKRSKPLMAPRQMRLLRESFRQIQPRAGIASLIFYRNLFTLDPGLRPLFQSSIELQGRKLMEALSYTVATIDSPEALVPALEALGRRHVSYGTRDEHYATVTKALLQTLEEILGRAFTADTRAAWKTALEFVAKTMKRGGEPVRELRAG